MMRMFLSLLLVFSLFITPFHVSANENSSAPFAMQIFVDEKLVQSSVPPQIVNGQTLVPLRVVAEQLGAKVRWNGTLQQISITGEATEIILTLGSQQVFINGEERSLTIAPSKIQGVTMVPFRFVSEQLDCKVTWDRDANAIYVVKNDKSAQVSVSNMVKRVLRTSAPPVEQTINGNGVLQSIYSTPEALLITTTKKITPRLFALQDPHRLVIDLPETLVDPLANLQFQNLHPLINKLRFAQNTTNPALVRIVIELKDKPVFRYTAVENSFSFLVFLSGEPATTPAQPSPPTAPTPAPVQTPVQTPTPVTPSPAPKQSTPTPTSSGGKSVPTASHGEPRFALVEDVSTKDHQVIIQLNKFIPWTSFVVDNPDRIVIDLPEAFLGETLRKVVKSTIPAVQQVRIGQNSYDPALAKVVIDLHKKSPYQIFDDPEKKQITVDFSVQPSEAANTATQSTTADVTPIPVDQPFVEAKSGGKYVVVIDAGHGGTDTGAISPYRKQAYEKDFNLTVSLKVQKMLAGHPSIKVHLTRTDDTFITLIDRVNFANQLNADAFVSIHANAFKDRPTIRGTETFYSRQDSITLSTIMHRQMLVATGFPDRLLKKADYRVIKSTKMPAVLLESGFISNPVEEKQIFDPLFQDRVAQAVVNGLKEYFSLNN